jgi:hypothetical protein
MDSCSRLAFIAFAMAFFFTMSFTGPAPETAAVSRVADLNTVVVEGPVLVPRKEAF